MATKPVQSIFPIENGKLITALDANNFPIHNLDVANSEGIGTGGNGASHTVTFVGSITGDVITADQAIFLDSDIGSTISGGALTGDAFIVLVTSPTVVQVSESPGDVAGAIFIFDRLPVAGNDTGTTTAILKGDGDHGLADAIADVDYALPSSVNLKENITDHDADILVLTNDLSDLTTVVGTNTSDIALKANAADVTASLALKTDLNTFESYQASNDSAVALKADEADLTALTDVVALKALDSDLQAYITSNDAEVALKAYTTDVDTALALKADDSALTTGLALKEPLLPTSPVDGWILSGNTDDSKAWVDPVTLGTSNQTFTDGASNTDTSWESNQANFVDPDDVGLSITGTNIPDGTTIASVTDENTIVLSQATTGSGINLTFTIYNRLTLAVGGGTVTAVSVNNLATELLSTSVSNSTTSPLIGISIPTGTGPNRFWGNPNAGSGAATFMSAAQARTSLGGTTVGQAIFQATSISATSWPRVNADNSVTMRSSANVLLDIGGESALTFSPGPPFSRSSNTISLAQATTAAAGYLSATDWNTFNNKLSSSLTIATTSPLTGGGDLSTNRTLAIPAATTAVSGYLTSTDWTTFNAKLSSTRTITTTAPLTGGGNLTADRTIAIPPSSASVDGYLTQGDFATFTAKPPNSRTIATTAPLTGGGDLSANRTIAMPKATGVVDGYLAAVDFAAFNTGSPHTQEIALTNGTIAVTSQTPPITRVVIKNPVTALTITLPAPNLYGTATGYSYLEFVDAASPPAMTSGSITLSTSAGTIDGQTTFTLPRGMGYLRLNSDGLTPGKWTTSKYFVDSFIDPLVPTKSVRVDVSSIVPGSPRVIRPAPSADSVTIVPADGPSGPSSPVGPADGLFIYNYDANGKALWASPGSGVPTLGSEGTVLTVSNGSAVWAGGPSVFQYVPLTDAATITWACVANQRTQNAYVTINGNRTLNITGAQSGMHFNLFVIQGAGSNTLAVPTGSLTPTNGLGLLNPALTTTIGACDLIEGDYVGTTRIPYAWRTTALNLTGAVAASCTVAGAVGAVSGTSVISNNGAAKAYIASNFDATGTAICAISANLRAVGLPNFNISAGIFTDVVRTNGTVTNASTTSGLPTITATTVAGAPNWVAADIGQRITGAGGGALPGFPAGTYYIASTPTTTTCTVSNTKGGGAVNADATLSNQTMTTYGQPGTIVGDWSTNTLSSTQVPTFLNAAAGTPNADTTAQSFTGVTATGLTIGATYWMVIKFGGVPTLTDYIDLLFAGTVSTIGYSSKWSTNAQAATPVWTSANAGHKTRWATFHA